MTDIAAAQSALKQLLMQNVRVQVSNNDEAFLETINSVRALIGAGLDELTFTEAMDNGGPSLGDLKKAIFKIQNRKLDPANVEDKMELYQGIAGVQIMVDRAKNMIVPVEEPVPEHLKPFRGVYMGGVLEDLKPFMIAQNKALEQNKSVLENIRDQLVQVSGTLGLADNYEQISKDLQEYRTAQATQSRTDALAAAGKKKQTGRG